MRRTKSFIAAAGGSMAVLIVLAAVCVLFARSTAGAAEAPYKEGEVIVQLLPAETPQPLAGNFSSVNLRPVRLLSKRLNIWLMAYDHAGMKAADRQSLLENIRSDKAVNIAQHNHYIAQRATTPNDTYFSNQWDKHNTGQNGGTPDADIDAPEAWDLTTGGTTALGDEIVIAVVDGGVQLSHPDISFWKNTDEIPGNGIDDDNNGYIDDYDGWNAYNNSGSIPLSSHGTHVSGIAAAIGNNGAGVAGVNWGVKVLPIAGSTGTEAIAVAAYGYVVELRATYNETNGEYGAYIVATNSSFGVDYGDPANFPLWCEMYNTMGELGILSAAATANLNINVDVQGDVPTACGSDYLVSVTNTTNTDAKNSGAAYGATTIDLGAPGTSIYSTYPTSTYTYLTGTSMATPQVAGAIALMYAAAGSALIEQSRTQPGVVALLMKQLLLSGVDPKASLQGITVSGGRLNVFNSCELVNALNPCTDPDYWEITFGDDLSQEALSVAEMGDGGYVVAGYSRPYDAAAIYSDQLLLRTDDCGNIQWSKIFGGDGTDYLTSVRATPSDGGFIVGGYVGPAGTYNISDFYIGKFNSSGDSTWTHTMTQTSPNWASAIPTSDNGYVFVGGGGGSYIGHTFLYKYNSSGVQMWTDDFWDDFDQMIDYDPRYVIESSNGYILVLVDEYDDWYDEYAISIRRWDLSGNRAGGYFHHLDDHIHGRCIQQTSDGGYIITAYRTTPGYPNNRDVVLYKLTSSFTLEWTKTYTGNALTKPGEIRQLPDGGYAVVGTFSWSPGDLDVMRTNTTGDSLWTEPLGGTSGGLGSALILPTGGGYVVGGMSRSFGDTENGDLYLARMAPEPNQVTLVSPASGASFYAVASPTLVWNSVTGAESYQVVLDNNADFGSPIANPDGLTGTSWQCPGLGVGTYYWRVRARHLDTWGKWSEKRNFTVRTRPNPSCPVLFTSHDGEYRMENPLLTACEKSGYVDVVTDYYQLPTDVDAVNGVLTMQIRELEDEISYLHDFELITVDHSPQYKIACSVDGRIVAVDASRAPIAVVDQNGVDHLAELQAEDGNLFSADGAGYLLVTFSAVSDDVTGVELPSLAKIECPIVIEDPGNPVPKVDPDRLLANGELTVEVLGDDNLWHELPAVPPRENIGSQILITDLAGRTGDEVTFRLSFTNGYSADVIGQVVAAAETPTIRNLTAEHNRFSTADGAAKAIGGFTAGDPLVLHKGETVELSFSVGAPPTNQQRDFIVRAVGRYEPDYSVYTNLMPNRYRLYDNYPNPFNPTTTISYDLPEATQVTLDIYNVLGRRVARLIDERQDAGHHQVEWDATANGQQAASGIYFYRLTTESFSASRKMMLLK